MNELAQLAAKKQQEHNIRSGKVPGTEETYDAANPQQQPPKPGTGQAQVRPVIIPC